MWAGIKTSECLGSEDQEKCPHWQNTRTCFDCKYELKEEDYEGFWYQVLSRQIKHLSELFEMQNGGCVFEVNDLTKSEWRYLAIFKAAISEVQQEARGNG